MTLLSHICLFWTPHTACMILVPQGAWTPCVEAWNLHCCTTRELPIFSYSILVLTVTPRIQCVLVSVLSDKQEKQILLS